MSIKTDHVIQTRRRQDIVAKDKELDHTSLIDIAVSGDGRVKDDKEQEKVEKVSRFGERTGENLEYLWDSCSHCCG